MDIAPKTILTHSSFIYDKEKSCLSLVMDVKPRQNMRLDFLVEVYNHTKLTIDGANKEQIKYFILRSACKEVFNLGGDLNLFVSLIRSKNREGLLRYAKQCIDQLYLMQRMKLFCHTIALIQGTALGGGFEAALACEYVIAEKSAKMGFPEIRFNMFPGMGGYNFLYRRVGRVVADKVIRDSKVLSGQEWYDLGVIDRVVENGYGEQAIEELIQKENAHCIGSLALSRAENTVNPVTYEELYNIIEIWTESAMGLTERDLGFMEKLVKAQTPNHGVAQY